MIRNEPALLTEEGLAKLQAEYTHLTTVGREELADRLHHAFEDGQDDDFVDNLYIQIDKILGNFEKNPELHQHDSEDRMTIEIANGLNLIGYNVTHEEKIGGHADLSVKHRNGWLWIGEAKIHSDYGYLWQGFQQLTTRYTTGNDNQNAGGLIIYIRNKNAKSVIDTWKERLNTNYGIQEFSPCPKRESFSFFTRHVHSRSGIPFNVRHMGVVLGFDPRDRK